MVEALLDRLKATKETRWLRDFIFAMDEDENRKHADARLFSDAPSTVERIQNAVLSLLEHEQSVEIKTTGTSRPMLGW